MSSLSDSMPYDMVDQECINGHRWVAPMHFELGGWFLSQ